VAKVLHLELAEAQVHLVLQDFQALQEQVVHQVLRDNQVLQVQMVQMDLVE
jgi:hypothetical protein